MCKWILLSCAAVVVNTNPYTTSAWAHRMLRDKMLATSTCKLVFHRNHMNDACAQLQIATGKGFSFMPLMRVRIKISQRTYLQDSKNHSSGSNVWTNHIAKRNYVGYYPVQPILRLKEYNHRVQNIMRQQVLDGQREVCLFVRACKIS